MWSWTCSQYGDIPFLPYFREQIELSYNFPVMCVCESEACLETSTEAGPSDLMNSLWSHTNCGPSRGLLCCRSTHVIITMIFRLWCTGM